VTPRQLPPTVPCFAGRAAELEILTRPCDQRADGCTAMPISAISGMAGVGKTALALTWAHRMADRFPDGQLYVNLRGSDQFRVPMSPDEAVCGFLEALHVPPQEIPGSMAAKVGLYRSVLYGKRVLVVLDHARDSEQVRSLLPGAPGCLVVVTSRNHLSGLIATHGAQPLILEPLSRPEARKLLGSRLSPERFAGERFAIEDVISQCEGLPQKLAIVAARAAASPQLSLPALAAQLRQDQGGPEPKISTAGN
jgi:predicted ATPase